MIKHSKEKPPNWEKMCEVFSVGHMWEKGLIVTWEDTYHCVYEIPGHLIAHEETHTKQHEAMGVEKWWDRYYEDPQFRLEQEVEAYKNQVKYIQTNMMDETRDYRRSLIRDCAKALASEIYGGIISYDRALELIKG